MPGGPQKHMVPASDRACDGLSVIFWERVLRNLSIVDEPDDSLTKQVLNMILENNAFMPYIVGWLVFNVLILLLVIYISIRISLK